MSLCVCQQAIRTNVDLLATGDFGVEIEKAVAGRCKGGAVASRTIGVYGGWAGGGCFFVDPEGAVGGLDGAAEGAHAVAEGDVEGEGVGCVVAGFEGCC